jgi:hypothetical protein
VVAAVLAHHHHGRRHRRCVGRRCGERLRRAAQRVCFRADLFARRRQLGENRIVVVVIGIFVTIGSTVIVIVVGIDTAHLAMHMLLRRLRKLSVLLRHERGNEIGGQRRVGGAERIERLELQRRHGAR